MTVQLISVSGVPVSGVRGRPPKTRRTAVSVEGMHTVVGYVRVSTDAQADSGAGLEAQRGAIRAECARRGWTLQHIYEDTSASGKTLKRRPGLNAAISHIEGGSADGLVVSKLDRLSRSVLDFARLMERAREKGWALLALDSGVDPTTPHGEMMVNVLASFAQYERRVIGQRTKDALAVKRSGGVRLGRRSTVAPETRRRIARLRKAGKSLQAIADALTKAGVPTGQGGQKWYPSSVSAVLHAVNPRSGREMRNEK